MRGIKFRAWDKDNEVMFYSEDNQNDDFTFIAEKGGLQFYYIDKGDRYLQDTNSVLMQYTGLKDKNGVEIYEGDILSTDLDRPYLIVEFRNGAFMFLCHDDGKDYYDFMATTGENSNFTKYHEVIGNIYENPELLSDSQ